MRALFGLAGLLVVMAIVGVLMKQNLSATRAGSAAAPVAVDGVKVPQVDTGKNLHEQSQQIQQQVQDQLNQALQQDTRRLQDAEK